jgi:hypothetical protein
MLDNHGGRKELAKAENDWVIQYILE